MGNADLGIKALQGIFVVPRIEVSVATVEEAATRERRLLMGRKLLRFMNILGVIAVFFGMWLLSYGAGVKAGWMRAKRLLVLRLIGYHARCGVLYLQVASGRKTRSHVWFRWFNEAPALLLTAIGVLVIVKPF